MTTLPRGVEVYTDGGSWFLVRIPEFTTAVIGGEKKGDALGAVALMLRGVRADSPEAGKRARATELLNQLESLAP